MYRWTSSLYGLLWLSPLWKLPSNYALKLLSRHARPIQMSGLTGFEWIWADFTGTIEHISKKKLNVLMIFRCYGYTKFLPNNAISESPWCAPIPAIEKIPRDSLVQKGCPPIVAIKMGLCLSLWALWPLWGGAASPDQRDSSCAVKTEISTLSVSIIVYV